MIIKQHIGNICEFEVVGIQIGVDDHLSDISIVPENFDELFFLLNDQGALGVKEDIWVGLGAPLPSLILQNKCLPHINIISIAIWIMEVFWAVVVV